MPTTTANTIIVTAADIFGFDEATLVGHSRKRPLVLARHTAMYLCRELTDLSYPAIAREFGGRDHTTVMHAVEKIGFLLDHDNATVAKAVARLREVLARQAVAA